MSEAQKQPLRIEDVLREKGLYVSTTAGVSMYPMLRDRRDTIMIRPAEGRLKKYDVPLYRRGEAYVLHRIVKVLPDSYVICGDNCFKKEYGDTGGADPWCAGRLLPGWKTGGYGWNPVSSVCPKLGVSVPGPRMLETTEDRVGESEAASVRKMTERQ